MVQSITNNLIISSQRPLNDARKSYGSNAPEPVKGPLGSNYKNGLNVLSLFDGISCARVALERANIKIKQYLSSEVDKYAIQVAQKNYPATIQLGSVVGLTSPPNIDLLVGGSPCQDLSIAQKNRKGLDGERSGLFWEYVRILKEAKPRWFILENVASMPKEAKEIITKELGVEPIMINAALVSAQNRKRLFWTNIPNIKLPDDRGIFLKDILEDGIGNQKSYCVPATYYKENVKSLIKRNKTGLMVRVGQFNSGGQGDRVYSPEGKSVGLSALGGGRGAKTGLYAVSVSEQVVGRKRQTDGSWKRELEPRKDAKSSAITSNLNRSLIAENSIIRKLTPVECERLMTLPDRYTEGVSNSQRYKMLGNGFVVEVVAHILKHINK